MNYLRRESGQKKVKRVLRAMGDTTYSPGFYDADGELARHLLKTRVPCSGPCCGNPRRWYGTKTLQEIRADIAMNDEN